MSHVAAVSGKGAGLQRQVGRAPLPQGLKTAATRAGHTGCDSQ